MHETVRRRFHGPFTKRHSFFQQTTTNSITMKTPSLIAGALVAASQLTGVSAQLIRGEQKPVEVAKPEVLTRQGCWSDKGNMTKSDVAPTTKLTIPDPQRAHPQGRPAASTGPNEALPPGPAAKHAAQRGRTPPVCEQSLCRSPTAVRSLPTNRAPW